MNDKDKDNACTAPESPYRKLKPGERRRLELELWALAGECTKLGRYLEANGKGRWRVVTTKRHTHADLITVTGSWEGDTDGCISYDTLGNVVKETWSVSGHNGDTYGHKEEALDVEGSLKEMKALKKKLERHALDAEERLLEEQGNGRRAEEAKKNLASKLKRF